MKEAQRLIVPDLARGTALIGIAMANTLQSWIVNSCSAADAPGWSIGGINPDSPLDAWAAVFTTILGCFAALCAFSAFGAYFKRKRPLRGGLRAGDRVHNY